MYVVSDKLQRLSGSIHARLLDFSGKVLLDQTKDISMPAQSSTVYLSLEKTELFANADPRQSLPPGKVVAYTELRTNGPPPSRSTLAESGLQLAPDGATR